jgi:hypothetical protein
MTVMDAEAWVTRHCSSIRTIRPNITFSSLGYLMKQYMKEDYKPSNTRLLDSIEERWNQ